MWVFTTCGFYSVVQTEANKRTGEVTVRARVKSDLTRLKRKYLKGNRFCSKITEDPRADYRFRFTVQRDVFADVMFEATKDIDYPNFKAEVHRLIGPCRANVYNQIWRIMLRLQEGELADDFGPRKDNQLQLEDVGWANFSGNPASDND